MLKKYFVNVLHDAVNKNRGLLYPILPLKISLQKIKYHLAPRDCLLCGSSVTWSTPIMHHPTNAVLYRCYLIRHTVIMSTRQIYIKIKRRNA